MEWESKGKTIGQLIKELQSFEDQSLEVKISLNNGASFRCISLVGMYDAEGVKICGLINHEQAPNKSLKSDAASGAA